MLNEDKINFCIRYLSSNGIDASTFESIKDSLSSRPIVEFALVRQDSSFFEEVAKGLRELWPAGNKEGKWAWRSPVSELTERLKFIWREQDVTQDYSVDDCLSAARQYLSRFEHNSTKYMLLCKYFIFKQKSVGVDKNGVYKVDYVSPLLNILQDKKEQEDLEALFEGEII